jgi:signal transduction histidine kinase
MQLRIKTKIALGLLFIFILIVVNGGMGYYYLNRLASASDAIIRDNYLSVQYCRQMSEALDRYDRDHPSSLDRFENQLREEEKDITEPGEGELAGELRMQLSSLRTRDSSRVLVSHMQTLVYQIEDLNLEAILRKNQQAHQTAVNALVWVAAITTLSFLIGFTFLVNFPGYIGNPVSQLTEGIKAIAAQHYSERLHFTSKDEFGVLANAFNVMAAKLDEYEHSNLAKISFEKKRIETLIDNMGDAIIGLDEKNYILFANHMALSILDMDRSALVGAYAPDIALHHDLLHRLLDQGDHGQLLKIFSGGRESYFTRDVLPVHIGGQNSPDAPIPAGQVIILKNITHFQELDMARTNFIATISHELKTPIASIQMSMKLLEDSRIGTLNPEQLELIRQAKDESRRLIAITKELLDLAQVETGNIKMAIQPTAARYLLEYATGALGAQAKDKAISVVSHCEPRTATVQADPEKTAWVLVNLLSNAIRYSPREGSVILGAKENGGIVEFYVQDFGQGIDSSYREKVFEKFFRMPGTSEEGTGLGLAISREFIVAQEGKIWLESEVGKGSRFCFSLPAAPP